MAETRLSVHVYDRQRQSNSSVFEERLKVLRSSADPQLYDCKFQTEGALTLNAFADNASVEPRAVAVSPYGWLMTHYGWLAVVSTAAA